MSQNEERSALPAMPIDSALSHMLGDNFLCSKIHDENYMMDSGETMSKIKLKLEDIQGAHNRIKEDVVLTPLIEAKYIGKKFCNLYLKCENLQNTGSFKARGVCNVLSNLSHSEKSKGCTVSGGRNFLMAMTHYGYKHSIAINVVVPKDCPLADKTQYRENFAIVKTSGADTNEACLNAMSFSDEIGTKYIHGSDRLDLLAGYGTLGLEILNQLDQVDAIVCPVGTGGLVASIIIAVKSLKPNCLIYGVECASTPAMTRALQEKKPILVPPHSTIADSLAPVMVSNNAFNIIRGYLDRMLVVDESWICRGMLTLLEREKMMVEGAGAASVAALMGGRVPELANKNVVCIISGGNINTLKLSRGMERGMAAEGRLVKFTVALADVVGSMSAVLNKVSELGADVKCITPEHTWMRRDVFTVGVSLTIETCHSGHAKELEKILNKEYPHGHFIML